MTKETPTTFTAVSPDGYVVTRKSAHAYGYAIFAKGTNGTSFYLVGFAKTRQAAERTATSARNDHDLRGWEHLHTNTEVAESRKNRKRNSEVVVVEATAGAK
jgi:hypothetical protein